MIHYGDITKLNGAELPIVDIVTGGSPCQGLSVAGLRKGLDDERSGLFIEQIRVIKEMREHDRSNGRTGKFIRPRYMVWENVIGAFTSNRGEDFRIVLEETARVTDKDATIPRPENGKWQHAGCVMGDGWSIAWRVHDAQFWGVPQRRKRIALVADFGGQSAPEILFERKSVLGHIEEGEEERQGSAGTVGTNIEETGRIGVDVYNQEVTGNVAATVTAACGGTNTSGCKVIDRQTDRQILLSEQNCRNFGCELLQGLRRTARDRARSSLRWQRATSPDDDEQCCEHLRHDARPAGHSTEKNVIYDARGNGDGKICCTLTGDHQSSISDYTAIVVEDKKVICIEMTSTKNTIIENGISPTLTARMGTGGNQVNSILDRRM